MLIAPLAAVAVVAIGCGTASDSQDEQPYAFGDSLGNGPCKTDADCAAGQSCKKVRIGELDQSTCVRNTVPDDAEDGGAPIVSDAAPPPPPTDGGTEVIVVDSGPPPPPITAPDGGSLCSEHLTVTISSKGPFATCGFNTKVVETSPATLEYACPGDGAAQVTFGTQVFSGSVTSGNVSLTNVETYAIKVPNTGTTCQYISTQTITGPIAGPLSYNYTEKLAPGQPPICTVVTVACYENGPVAVSP